MKPIEQLKKELLGLDGRDYGAYQAIKGPWRYPHFELHMDRIPKDPYAPPHTGVYRVRIPRDQSGFPAELSDSPVKSIALRDFLARRIHGQCEALSGGRRGTGNSGLITIAEPGQQILERSSVIVDAQIIEARMSLGLPASGRAIDANLAIAMLAEELPRIVEASLFYSSLEPEALGRHLEAAEDSHWLRSKLASRNLVAFIPDGATLPRRSGVDPRPLDAAGAVRFHAPQGLRVGFDLPHAGPVTGMGVPRGVTLIVGGGYHGKSTLLQALELGIYDHIPGDGRENCVSGPHTVKVRATSGRSVVDTDISVFITDIPRGGASTPLTTSFSTANASGSTSQAVFIAEAMEAGASLLLMDEDTCAANLMVRDKRMQELVAKAHEPITVYLDRVRQLYTQHGISTILVMGGSGEYFSAADCVIQMKAFQPHEVTGQAHEIAARFPTNRELEGAPIYGAPGVRCPLDEGLHPNNEYGKFRITASETHRLTYGDNTVELSDVEQLVEPAQTRGIGRAILHARQYMDGRRTMREISERVQADIQEGGLDVLDPQRTGNLARFRVLEFAAALNRMRTLKVRRG